MKTSIKFPILLIGIIVSLCSVSKSQTLTASPSTIASGATANFYGSGETATGYYFSYLSFNPTVTVTTSPYSGLQTWIYCSNVIEVPYSLPSQTASHITMKITNSFNQPITATLTFNTNMGYNYGSSYLLNQTKTVSITVNPASATTYYSAATSQDFTKNDCTGSQIGSVVNYSVAAGAYTSTISQADANSKAAADIASNGQTYANNNGACTDPPPTISGYNTICDDGSDYVYTIQNLPAGVTVSSWTARWSMAETSHTSTTITAHYSYLAPYNKGQVYATLSNSQIVYGPIVHFTSCP